MASLGGSLKRLWLQWRYNDYTIAEYFRAQGAAIGSRTRILVRELGSEPYLVSIGDDTLVSSGVAFYTHDGAVWVLRAQEPTLNRFKRISVGRRCFIGARAVLLPGATVGDGSVIGAGSVVAGEIPAGAVAAGVPAKVLCSVEEWAARVREESLPLTADLFPLDSCDRKKLQRELTRLLPPLGEGER
jgi:acetyltransferase-like isoleucine patch superfamily enzyme